MSLVEGGGGIDRPGLLRFRVGLAGGVDGGVAVLGAPLPCGVEVLQAEADRVDRAMAARALRVFLVRQQPLTGGEHLPCEAGDGGNIRRCWGRRVVEELPQDPGAAFDGARAIAIATHEEDGGHAEQPAARRPCG